MKLAMILEAPLPPVPPGPGGPPKPGELAPQLAGPNGQAQNDVRKQLETQQQIQKKATAKPPPQMKRSLQQLQNVPWNPKNSKFKQLAGEVLGGGKPPGA